MITKCCKYDNKITINPQSQKQKLCLYFNQHIPNPIKFYNFPKWMKNLPGFNENQNLLGYLRQLQTKNNVKFKNISSVLVYPNTHTETDKKRKEQQQTLYEMNHQDYTVWYFSSNQNQEDHCESFMHPPPLTKLKFISPFIRDFCNFCLDPNEGSIYFIASIHCYVFFNSDNKLLDDLIQRLVFFAGPLMSAIVLKAIGVNQKVNVTVLSSVSPHVYRGKYYIGAFPNWVNHYPKPIGGNKEIYVIKFYLPKNYYEGTQVSWKNIEFYCLTKKRNAKQIPISFYLDPFEIVNKIYHKDINKVTLVSRLLLLYFDSSNFSAYNDYILDNLDNPDDHFHRNPTRPYFLYIIQFLSYTLSITELIYFLKQLLKIKRRAQKFDLVEEMNSALKLDLSPFTAGDELKLLEILEWRLFQDKRLNKVDYFPLNMLRKRNTNNPKRTNLYEFNKFICYLRKLSNMIDRSRIPTKKRHYISIDSRFRFNEIEENQKSFYPGLEIFPNNRIISTPTKPIIELAVRVLCDIVDLNKLNYCQSLDELLLNKMPNFFPKEILIFSINSSSIKQIDEKENIRSLNLDIK